MRCITELMHSFSRFTIVLLSGLIQTRLKLSAAIQMCLKLRFCMKLRLPFFSDTAKNSILLETWLIKHNIFNCDSMWIRMTISKNSKCRHKIYYMRPDVRFFS
jgi:hypothetical protein